MTCWRELNYNTNALGRVLAGRSILLSQFLQILIMGNYVYYYLKSYGWLVGVRRRIMTGTPLILPIYRLSREECVVCWSRLRRGRIVWIGTECISLVRDNGVLYVYAEDNHERGIM